MVLVIFRMFRTAKILSKLSLCALFGFHTTGMPITPMKIKKTFAQRIPFDLYKLLDRFQLMTCRGRQVPQAFLGIDPSNFANVFNASTVKL